VKTITPKEGVHPLDPGTIIELAKADSYIAGLQATIRKPQTENVENEPDSEAEQNAEVEQYDDDDEEESDSDEQNGNDEQNDNHEQNDEQNGDGVRQDDEGEDKEKQKADEFKTRKIRVQVSAAQAY